MKFSSSPNPDPRPPHATSGFTLVEMAMVMVIIGLVMLTIFPALTAVRAANQRALTVSNLHSLMLATASYVQANGCLPCPAIAGATGANFGKLGYYTAATSPTAVIACGNCTAPEGIPPFVALGVPASTAHDGWGHWITMRIDPALAVNFGVYPPTAPCQCSDFASASPPASCSATVPVKTTSTATCLTLNASQKGMCQTGLSSANRISVTTVNGATTQSAAVIFVSHGSSGYGSFIAQSLQQPSWVPFPTNSAACAGPNSGLAQCNSAANNSRQFYDSSPYSSPTDTYDDILAYADRNSMVSMLGNGSCATVW